MKMDFEEFKEFITIKIYGNFVTGYSEIISHEDFDGMFFTR